MRRTHLLFLILTLIMISSPEAAHAQALFDSGTNFLNAFSDLLTGTWARIAGIIAIVITGFTALTGRLSWARAATVIGGLILIFGAAAIVDSVAGSL